MVKANRTFKRKKYKVCLDTCGTNECQRILALFTFIMSLNHEQLKKFEHDGFLIFSNFIGQNACNELRDEMEKIIESHHFIDEINKISVFDANESDEGNARRSDLHFLTSTDKIRPFLEKRANEIIGQNDGTKSKNVFNKIGHALHALNPVFKQHSFSENTKQAFKALGFKKPTVCQSMYIFKQPFIGGEVSAHQDATYIYNEPLKVVGIWIALEDCTLENGCLEFIPGSHKSEPLGSRFIRNPNKEEFDQGKFLIHTKQAPKYDDSRFVPAQVKAGDAIFIHGLVVHKSRPNLSPKSRHIYTFHVYEAENSTFSKENWMEENPISFLNLYEH